MVNSWNLLVFLSHPGNQPNWTLAAIVHYYTMNKCHFLSLLLVEWPTEWYRVNMVPAWVWQIIYCTKYLCLLPYTISHVTYL